MKVKWTALWVASALAAVVPGLVRAQAAPAAVAVGLRPGDALRLRIWREPDLSGEFPVDDRGMAVLPRLGPTAVTGISTDSLRAELVRRYEVFLRNPAIDVTPLRRIKVLGAVKRPGLYPVDATMTLSDVIALAEGVMPDGNPDAVRILREGKPVADKLAQGVRITDTPLQSGDQVYVPQRSWAARNPSLVPALVSGAFSVVVSLIIIRR